MFSAVPIDRVFIDDQFWAPRLETNRRVTIPMIYERCQESGRIDALRLHWKEGQPNKPHVFWESDVAKWMEAAAYSLRTKPDAELEARLEELISLLTKAQQPDGYLNAYYTVVEPGRRWTNLRDKHELYCAGHLIEAAVAHFEATGQRSFLNVMCRYADYVAAVFGRGTGQKRGYCGHPEIELALVRLFRATGESRYLKMAEYFINERGAKPHYFDEEAIARGEDPAKYWAKTHAYTQSHAPVREQNRAVGHAVRALYLYCGMMDVARETGDKSLLEACGRLWESVYQKQLYVTGGIGPSRENEGFTHDYDLPNDTAYAETCAAIASVFWNHRLLQWRCDSRFGDEMERALYNGVLSGVSMEGDTFFYVNPLEMHAEEVKPDDPYLKAHRMEWFGCACCPPNIARLLASLGQYIYSEGERDVAVHLYVQSHADCRVAGRHVRIRQESEYPWKGRIRITVEAQSGVEFCLRLRIPGWARSRDVAVNGKPTNGNLENGYLALRRKWERGDTVDLILPMPIERVRAHPNVRADFGRVALQRGPVVYCVESIDVGVPVSSLVLPRQSEFLAVYEKQLFGGTTTIRGEAAHATDGDWERELYRADAHALAPVPFKAVPYPVWGNRSATEMAVWLRES
ncbi:MAG: glycoside hydrolase family 127 protein [Verrucomicrobia subdivision 3 bacterium]|nr:glycoside hydrolase family 127 protein [Limisphaerales bacterium]